MDLNFSPEEIAFRDEVRSFLASEIPMRSSASSFPDMN